MNVKNNRKYITVNEALLEEKKIDIEKVIETAIERALRLGIVNLKDYEIEITNTLDVFLVNRKENKYIWLGNLENRIDRIIIDKIVSIGFNETYAQARFQRIESDVEVIENDSEVIENDNVERIDIDSYRIEDEYVGKRILKKKGIESLFRLRDDNL